MTEKTQRLRNYLQKTPQFDSESSINPYYRQYDPEDEGDSYMVDFWKQVIADYSFTIEKGLTISTQTLIQQFTVHHTVPFSLGAIMQTLKAQGHMASKADIVSGVLYKQEEQDKSEQKGWIGGIASTLYSSTFGYFSQQPEPEVVHEDEFINVEFLESQVENLLKWAVMEDYGIHTETDLKNHLRNQDILNESDIDLLFTHMEHSGRMARQSLDKGAVFCKLSKPQSLEIVQFSQSELAENSLNYNLKHIDSCLEKLQIEIVHYETQIKSLLLAKNKTQALALLRHKKLFEKRQNELLNQRMVVSEQLLTLESVEGTNEILQTLKETTSITKEILQQDQNSDLISELSEQMAETKQLTEQTSSFFIDKGISQQEEDDLINELDNLCLDKAAQELGTIRIDQESIDAQRMAEKLAEKDRQFNLQMNGGQSSNLPQAEEVHQQREALYE